MRGGSLTRYDPYEGLGGQRGGSAAWKFAAPILKQAAKPAALSYLERIKGGSKRKTPSNSDQVAKTGAKRSKGDIFGT